MELAWEKYQQQQQQKRSVGGEFFWKNQKKKVLTSQRILYAQIVVAPFYSHILCVYIGFLSLLALEQREELS